jgi:hypothetical protein
MLCVACLSLLCTYSGLAAPVFSTAAEPRLRLVVVVEKSSPLSELSLRDLKRLYLGQYITDPDGKQLMALNHPAQSPERVAFDQVVLKMTPDQTGRFWIDRKIRGQPAAPRSVAPRELLRKFVAASPGAVTYLRDSEVDPQLKALAIEGKRPQDAGYPLQF